MLKTILNLPVATRRRAAIDVLKVSSKSSPTAVAGALAAVIRERGNAELQAIGAGAVNQAVKAVAIARGFVAPRGVAPVCVPAVPVRQGNPRPRTEVAHEVTLVADGVAAPSGSRRRFMQGNEALFRGAVAA